MRYYFTATRMTIIKENGKFQSVGEDRKETGTFLHDWRERKMVLSL